MLRITLDINGRDIGEIGVWNRQERNEDGETRYSVYNLRGEDASVCEDRRMFDVWHHRAYGAASLTVVVMGELDEGRLDQPPK